MRVTIKQIAQELGISHSTVSRVLNDKQTAMVSETTRHRIMQMASTMGYRPSRIAQALQGKSTQLIGVLVPDREDYFFQTVIKNLRETLEESEYELMVFASASHNIPSTWQRLLQWDMDGIFVFDYMFYVDGLWEALTKHTGSISPIVGLFSNLTQLKDYVTVDFRSALEELLEHLLAMGCTHLGYVGFSDNFDPSEQRYEVFAQFVKKHGLEQSNIAMQTGLGLMESARHAISNWVADGRKIPQALFCQNDEIALGAYRALHQAGVQVPGEVAVAGCDNLPYMAYLETPLTSLALPVQDVCRQGWSILQKRMAEPLAPPMQIVLDVHLILRESTEISLNEAPRHGSGSGLKAAV